MFAKTAKLRCDERLLSALLELAKADDVDKAYELAIQFTMEVIGAAGCSIFLMNPLDGRLYIVSSRGIDRTKWSECTYAPGEGFTGWAQKNGFLYIPEQRDDVIKQISPQPQHLGAARGKPCETGSIGPFMAAPIESDGYHIGVIRAPADPSRQGYSEAERGLFKEFAAQLARSIENASWRSKYETQLAMNQRMIGANTVKEVVDAVVKDIPSILSAGGCSIFLWDQDTAQPGIRQLTLAATTGFHGEFREQLIGNLSYLEGRAGVTLWVATHGRSVNLTELPGCGLVEQYDPPIHHEKGPCEVDEIGPFLAAAVKDSQGRILGTIRVNKFKGLKPFTPAEEHLLEFVGTQIGISIESLKRIEESVDLTHQRLVRFRQTFSEPLIEWASQITTLQYGPTIKRLLTEADQADNLEDYALRCLECLWKLPDSSYNFAPLADFREYEAMLFELSGYRSHFVHQYQIFLLGAVIIDQINKLQGAKRKFADHYCESIARPHDPTLAEVAWMIASTFHDVAYPIEKIGLVLDTFFQKFLTLETRVMERARLDRALSDPQVRYLKYVDHLVDLHVHLDTRSTEKWTYDALDRTCMYADDEFRRNMLNQLLEHGDHGVLAALILLSQNSPETDEYSSILFPAALAMALHNGMLRSTRFPIAFETNPLAFLLAYLDNAQEWGRSQGRFGAGSSDGSILLGINVDDHQAGPRVEMVLRFREQTMAMRKDRQLDVLRGRLISSEIDFRIRVQNTGNIWASRPPTYTVRDRHLSTRTPNSQEHSSPAADGASEKQVPADLEKRHR
jgi:GAF domain-containing protein